MMSPRLTSALAVVPFATFAAPAAAQAPAAMADKTAIYATDTVSGPLNTWVYVAPSGNVYENTQGVGHGVGREFRIGRATEHAYSTGEIKCRARNRASAGGRMLSLRSTSTCAAPEVAPVTTSGTVRILFNGDTCGVTWTPRSNEATVSSCKVVAGNQMPK
jgi:hypothetical protein